MDTAQQPRDAIEAAVKATMTAQFDREMAVAVEAEKKRTELVKEELLAMQRTAENLKRDGELAIMRAKDALREDLTLTHSCELQTREEWLVYRRNGGRSESGPWNTS